MKRQPCSVQSSQKQAYVPCKSRPQNWSYALASISDRTRGARLYHCSFGAASALVLWQRTPTLPAGLSGVQGLIERPSEVRDLPLERALLMAHRLLLLPDNGDQLAHLLTQRLHVHGESGRRPIVPNQSFQYHPLRTLHATNWLASQLGVCTPASNTVRTDHAQAALLARSLCPCL